MAFLMFPPWLVVAACSVSCLEASGNPNDIPRRREHSEMDLQSPSPAALQKTFQKEDRFGELPRSHCLENSRLFIHFQKSVKAGKETWNWERFFPARSHSPSKRRETSRDLLSSLSQECPLKDWVLQQLMKIIWSLCVLVTLYWCEEAPCPVSKKAFNLGCMVSEGWSPRSSWQVGIVL